ncbi:MAG: universal stress protein [Pseudanabaenaceae cyanobacterium]
MFSKILFPVNQSREAKQAIGVVAEMVQKYQAQLFVMSAIQSEAEQPDAEALLAEMQEKLANMGITAETKISHGKPELAICDTADELEVDLIIMGSQGMTLAQEHPDGSTSQKVINLSPCPVLVVP